MSSNNNKQDNKSKEKGFQEWPSDRFLESVAGIIVGLGVILLALLLMQIFWPENNQSKEQIQEITAIIETLGLFAGSIILFLNFRVSNRKVELTESTILTELFGKALEQLGSDKIESRLGGIFSLERIAKDSPDDCRSVLQLLAAFVREYSKEPGKDGKIRIDVQEALTVIGRYNEAKDNTLIHRLDLSRADLTLANLEGANLGKVNLYRANLTLANLEGANLQGANLNKANLEGANLEEANLIGSELMGANLMAASLSKANFKEANLYKVQNLSHLQIKLACNWDEAIYTEAQWNIEKQIWVIADASENESKIEQIKQNKD